MKKLAVILFAFIFWSTASFANFNFHFYNHTNKKMNLIHKDRHTGGLYIPYALEAYSSDVRGHSTSTDDDSVGYFSYGFDLLNYCLIHYHQGWSVSTYYHVEIVEQVGRIACTVKQDHHHRSQVEIHYTAI